ncbi:MAG: methyltransferase [Defluviitaleaceae bacterium]|nr:methyltransferase [Defluviitaleaceae bacterium]MCL2835592.1 methyltransferase [Defluviitaleaceae bacterium]
MDTDKLFEAVKASKEYGGICGETVQRVIFAAVPKYKSEKLVLKSVKSTLREISAAFLPEAAVKRAESIMNETDWDCSGDVLAKTAEVLDLHQSTLERKRHFARMLCDIRRVTGFNSVLDVGCGLGPFMIPHTDCMKGVEYYAMDVHTRAIALVRKLIEKLGIKGEAFAGDILVKTPETSVDCVFMFKLLPLLERLEKNGARRVLGELNARYAAISFPTKTMSGKNVGMKDTYDAFMNGLPVIYREEYANEVLYITEK